MARYYSEEAILNYLDNTRENVRITTVDQDNQFPDYILTHLDTFSGEPTQIEIIKACYLGLQIGYTHRRYTKRIPKTQKEYIAYIGKKKLLPFDEWVNVIDEVKRCEAYWS